jgi:hypothetical protein
MSQQTSSTTPPSDTIINGCETIEVADIAETTKIPTEAFYYSRSMKYLVVLCEGWRDCNGNGHLNINPLRPPVTVLINQDTKQILK